MINSRRISVVTTIQPPTASMRTLAERLKGEDCQLLIIGDKKGPFAYDLPGAELVTLEEQLKLPYKLAGLLPCLHYARKNVGYLMAFKRGASCIYETDDDNTPLANWHWRELRVPARRCPAIGWVNVYRAFSQENIWPRGFPLELSQQSFPNGSEMSEVEAPIQQGLANGSPDVDAVWRLVLDKTITFQEGSSIFLPQNAWSPFNSQSTWWWPAAYPLMYLPSHCTFRMTDIWRSFVAQRCLWEMNTGLVFHGAEVWQDRNVHHLMTNFKDEVPGYLGNNEIVECLQETALKPGAGAVTENLLRCYEVLVGRGFLPEKEMDLVRAWVGDCESLLQL